jgi:hypothetical protein
MFFMCSWGSVWGAGGGGGREPEGWNYCNPGGKVDFNSRFCPIEFPYKDLLKILAYKVMSVPTFVCGCGSRVLTKRKLGKIQAAETRFIKFLLSEI